MFYFVFFTLCVALAGSAQVLLFRIFVLRSDAWHRKQISAAAVAIVSSIVVLAMSVTSMVNMTHGRGYQTFTVLWLLFIASASAATTHRVFKS